MMMLAKNMQISKACPTVNRRSTSGRISRRCFVRAQASEQQEPQVLAEPVGVGADMSTAQSTNLLGSTQEAINGRSAMLGFVAAVTSEALTHQSVWSQIAGKYVDTQMVEAPVGASSFGYFAVVVLVTVASLMPKLIDDLNVDSKSFGPFTPGLENILGRAAMIGFSSLIVIEAIKSSSML